MNYKNILIKKIFLLLIFIHSSSFAEISMPSLLKNSKQLILVLTPNQQSINGQLQSFERDSNKEEWKLVGKTIPVVIGKQGMSEPFRFKSKTNHSLIKQEGDGRTPMGIYRIGPTFGFDKKNTSNTGNYLFLSDTIVCVDDAQSIYYNQLIDSTTIPRKSWASGEIMRQVPQYKLGAVVQYNTSPVIRGAGSCIFLHVWKSPTSGTAGCIAMDESNLRSLLNWLDFKKQPVIAIFTMPALVNYKLNF